MHDLVPLALDLVHRHDAMHVEPLRRRAGLRQLARERHREAATMGGGEQLLRARLPLRDPDATARVYGSAENAPDEAR